MEWYDPNSNDVVVLIITLKNQGLLIDNKLIFGDFKMLIENEKINYLLDLISMAISSSEDADYFTKIFMKTKEYLYKKFDLIFNSRFSMADGAESIANSIKKSFPDFNRLVCYFHLKFFTKYFTGHIRSILA